MEQIEASEIAAQSDNITELPTIIPPIASTKRFRRRKQRSFTLSDKTIEQIDEYKVKQGLYSRSQAIEKRFSK